jgi:ABC-type lipoprotein export system ATPase subunit
MEDRQMVPDSGHGSGGGLMVELKDVSKFYWTGESEFRALKEVDLEIPPGEFVSVIGKSGSGKSTLLNMITGIDRPTTGEVWVNGTALHELDENQLAVWRGTNMGIVFQFFQLLPALSLLQNVILPMDLAGRYTRAERRARAEHLLEKVGLAEHADKLPSNVSGGQQQRAAMARAIANDPPILIADEPTGNLDSKTAETVFGLFHDLSAQGKTIIIVTHDSSLAKRVTRTALITDGEIVNEFVAKALPTLSPDQLLAATHKAEGRAFEAGAVILEEGKNSDAFYIVSRGMVEVVLPRAQQSSVAVLELGPGKYFGEMEFFHERRNRATIRAGRGGPAEVLIMDYGTLGSLLGQSEATREALSQAADRHEQENIGFRKSGRRSTT